MQSGHLPIDSPVIAHRPFRMVITAGLQHESASATNDVDRTFAALSARMTS